MGHIHKVEIFIFNHQFGFSALPMGRSSNGEDGLTEESLKTMSRYRKFTTICCAAVFALGLAACGGGDDGLNTSQEQELQEEKKAADEMVAELQEQLAALQERLGIEGDEDPGHDVADLRAQIESLEGQIEAAAEQERMETEKAAAAAMAATAAKLYAGIIAPNPTLATADTPTVVGTRYAQHTDSGIDVLISDNKVALSEDKDAMVADNQGWQGKKYTAAPRGGGMYEAVVYSNVEAPKMGKMFGSAAAVSDTGPYQYQLTNGAWAASDWTVANVRARVGLDIDRTAGTETFKLPSPNDDGATIITGIRGSYHGVSGTYTCDPTTDTSGCSAKVEAKGFTLSGGEWKFKPSDPNARVTESADTMYASYGWWIHKAANDGAFAASAFVSNKNAVTAATGLDALNGKATYMGGAAGKYALASSTGGTNDAGHFTAMVTLEADFNANTTANASDDPVPVGITGMIDNFMGADGMPRDWSVKLNGSPIGDDGEIGAAAGGTAMTVWTIGEDAAKADGSWTGTLYENKNDVPQVATGTFNAEYGTAGSMVGAFGANEQ